MKMRRRLILALGVLVLAKATAFGQTPDISIQLDEVPGKRLPFQMRQCVSVGAVPGKMKLREALQHLSRQHGFGNFLIDDSFAALHIKDIEDRLVSVDELRNVPRTAVLGHLLIQAGAWYEIQGDVILVLPYSTWVARQRTPPQGQSLRLPAVRFLDLTGKN
jgi:hypothetical protein